MAVAMMCGCARQEVRLTVSNAGVEESWQPLAEFSADSVLDLLGSPYCYVTDSKGEEVPVQITYDRKLIFPVTLQPGESGVYDVHPCDTLRTYPALVSGRAYPERADDFAWENQVNGYRAYGPATQAKGEKAFGYDIFFKHRTDRNVLEDIYRPETDPATWRKVDSLRNISPDLAEEFIASFSYHIDHGLGMDCYAVGPTLGAGVAALMDGDSIVYPWCYDKVEVLDEGPLRFTARLDFAPVRIGGDSAVVEHRLISLDAGSYLNDCKVWYDGLSGSRKIVAGVPRRDESEAIVDSAAGIIAYADPTQGPDNGKAMLGVIVANPVEDIVERDGHILAVTTIEPGDTLSYRWGFAWDREDIGTMTRWKDYLGSVKFGSVK